MSRSSENSPRFLNQEKNRMQVSGEGGATRLYKNSWHCARVIIRTEGIKGLYTGLSASLARQWTYSSVRLGMYNILLEKLTTDNKLPSFSTKVRVLYIK